MSTDAAFDEADLNAYVDGRIDPARGAALAASLASDPEGRARMESWKRQNESLRTMFASVLFEPVPVRLLPTAVPASPAPAPAAVAEVTRRSPARLAGIVATTSIGTAILGFALGALASYGTDGFGLAPASSRVAEVQAELSDSPTGGGLAQRAAETHRTFMGDAVRPVEMTAADEPKLLHWLQRRVGASLQVPDLQRQGWVLVGGRLVPGRTGPAAFLIYADGAERIGLYLARASSPGDGETGAVSGGAGVAVSAWRDGQFGYALTSDRGAAWLERNDRALRSEVSAQMRGDGAPP